MESCPIVNRREYVLQMQDLQSEIRELQISNISGRGDVIDILLKYPKAGGHVHAILRWDKIRELVRSRGRGFERVGVWAWGWDNTRRLAYLEELTSSKIEEAGDVRDIGLRITRPVMTDLGGGGQAGR
jgi:hypothetical protein